MILVMYYRIMYVKVAHMVWIWVKVLMCVWVHDCLVVEGKTFYGEGQFPMLIGWCDY